MRPPSSTAAACAAVAVAAAIAATPTAARTGATPTCRTPGLVIALEPTVQGTAGSVHYRLELTNLSGHACTLRGYPGVSAVTLAGRQIGKPASRSAATAKTVRLRQAQPASVPLRVVDTGNYPASRCHPTIAAGLRVYPPGDTRAKVVPIALRVCRRTSVDGLEVGPVVAGAG